MDLVEQHGGDTGELGIGLEAREIDAMGHGDEAGGASDPAVEAGLVADGRAGLLAQLASDELGRGPGSETAGDEQDDLAQAPGAAEQGGRNLRRLARARRGDKQSAGARIERGKEVGQDVVDGQRRGHARRGRRSRRRFQRVRRFHGSGDISQKRSLD